MRIVLDAMGGDFAPAVPVEGAIAALNEAVNDLEIILVGPQDIVQAELAKHGQEDNPRLRIVDAAQVISMSDAAGDALRAKTDSSLVRAIGLHAEREADAVISAGHTGAQMAASYMMLGLIEGVRRPTIGGLFPVGGGQFTLILDVGANMDSKPANLLQFAIMGSVFMEIVSKKTNPRVALLSIGEEKTKGNEQVQTAYYLLEESGLNFVGNLEGGDIFAAKADVLVCDGFVGNILLKFAESIGQFILERVNGMCGSGNAPSTDARQLFKDFDYSEVGGVPLLGVNGISMICHGRSTAKAIKSAIREAITLHRADLPAALAVGMEKYSLGVLARGMARLKRFHDKREQHDMPEGDND